MAVYAVGDVQGCYRSLRTLLDCISFDPAEDELWLTGDLVNRGPDSLAVLRFARSLGDSLRCVLGNHDLHLIALACGVRQAGRRDTLDEVLAAPDAAELIDWLRRRPLLWQDTALGWTMIHAGLPPQWTVQIAAQQARALETRLAGDDYKAVLAQLFDSGPDRWREDLDAVDALRFTAQCLTQLRYCTADGTLALRHKGRPGTQPAAAMPWFEVPDRKSRDARIVFGHWSTLGALARPGLLALDGGCVWGGELIAARLSDAPTLTRIACDEADRPVAERKENTG